ncbi:hypothetical protein CC80DRAFT_541846 [Byssothecium circinans]|uniref:Uncharacterized protein n=1 Tax=Byssothecium circinans TaxID=147558 RepID=A0A6A5UD59_9PLEO|nr:hypothetical protein CC80DRAFT_541846 [Byssothecium circinans]
MLPQQHLMSGKFKRQPAPFAQRPLSQPKTIPPAAQRAPTPGRNSTVPVCRADPTSAGPANATPRREPASARPADIRPAVVQPILPAPNPGGSPNAAAPALRNRIRRCSALCCSPCCYYWALACIVALLAMFFVRPSPAAGGSVVDEARLQNRRDIYRNMTAVRLVLRELEANMSAPMRVTYLFMDSAPEQESGVAYYVRSDLLDYAHLRKESHMCDYHSKLVEALDHTQRLMRSLVGDLRNASANQTCQQSISQSGGLETD